MRTTTSGRAFTKSIFDLFATLMVSLPIVNHKNMFKNYPNSFTAEAAIANLGGLQFIQSNRDTDPKDPTRIITHVTTTQFSLSRDMAKNLCQTFMDARLFENAMDPNKREFANRGFYQVTPKGAHILAKFVHRNKLPVEDTRHITVQAAANLVYLERADDEDQIILTQKHIEMIFKRFAGPEPNVAKPISPGDSPLTSSNGGRDRVQSVVNLCNGIEVKDQQHNYDVYKDTFYGKAAVEWLLDYTTVISKEEAICICQEMVTGVYIEQVGEENHSGPSLFRTGNSALYHLTETGRAVAGWKSLDSISGGSINNDWMDERGTVGTKSERNNPEAKPLSTQFKLTSSNLGRLPISVAREKRMSLDENSMTSATYSEDAGRGPMRRLSQILNDPAFQITLSDAGAMSSYAPSSSGKESVGTGAGAGAPGLSPPMSSSQPMASNTTRLNIILSNVTLRDLFKSFLKQNICEENLSFYLEVLDYKSKFNTLINSTKNYNLSLTENLSQPYPPSLRELEKQICTQAFAIYETYLVQGASREVNLPHQMRSDITAYMQAVVRNMETPETNNGKGSSISTPSSPSSPSSASGDNEGDKASGASPSKELIHISLFNTIHEHIFRLMSTDSVPKFTKTDKYREVMMNRVKKSNGNGVASSSSPTSPSISNAGVSTSNGNDGTPSSNGGGGSGGGGDGSARSPTNGSNRNEGHLHQKSTAESILKGGSGSHLDLASGSRSRTPSLANGLPPRYGSLSSSSAASSAVSPSSNPAGSVASPNNKSHTRLTRARSSSNAASHDAGHVLITQQNGSSSSGVDHSVNSTAESAKGLVVLPRQPPASLMEIYAQQQQLQQYGNQRAQLTPAQVQNMFLVRNSRSSSSSGSAVTNRSQAVGGESKKLDVKEKDTKSEQVTVLFESTSFAVQDPNAVSASAPSPDPLMVVDSGSATAGSPPESRSTPGHCPGTETVTKEA
ncbi:hypothetical protein BGZ50_003659 [Haplosporangium sp. Z 11]|nr:hypothetical protein BGZ50_003659 [Haplosporangium sp. Z 11]